MERISLKDGSYLLDLNTSDRWDALANVDWKKSCRKTYYERRTFINHILVNFSRIWCIVSFQNSFVSFSMNLIYISSTDFRFVHLFRGFFGCSYRMEV
jgi:hypothetical protein